MDITAQGTAADLCRRPVELLQTMIRFDTTNPPGNEAACIGYIDGLLRNSGLETSILARDESRPNLITRLAGRGEAPPLLMYGHVDVVTTEGQNWTHPPFAGRIADGYIWGRGALDMKGAVAMMLAALLRAKAEGLTPPGDVVLAVVSDEEANSEYGARYLVENHPERFAGIRYAIGEAGGFTFYVGQDKFYPIMLAEKQICWMKATVRGPAGHASMPVHGGAMARLAEVLKRLDAGSLPVHITPIAQQMIEQMASLLPPPLAGAALVLLDPAQTDAVLKGLGPTGQVLGPLLHHTVSPTILHGSTKINVIPAEVSVELDGRLLPGFGPGDMIAELRSLLGDEVELEVVRYEPGPPEPDMGLYGTLVDILRRADPEGVPGPFLMAGVTDGRHFARLGIQTYGFTPMKLPPELDVWKLAHAADERIPVDALDFGVEAIYELLQRFGEGAG
jgi:acetylornithine deacetylase/succinyl-diaminopimelate desuccinylase-like protein